MGNASHTKVARRLSYLSPNERAALDAFVRRLQAVCGDQVLLVRLFGSKARGDYHAESDVDVLVVVQGDKRRQYWNGIVDATSEILLDYGVEISPFIVDEDGLARLRRLQAPVLQRIRRVRS